MNLMDYSREVLSDLFYERTGVNPDKIPNPVHILFRCGVVVKLVIKDNRAEITTLRTKQTKG